MKHYIYTIIVVACFFAVSCVKEEADEPTLALSSMEAITFPKTASENSITITTNQAYWTAVTNADWIECEQVGNLLTVKALENNTTEKRKARVNVLAGGIGQSIEVHQEAKDVIIVTIPDKLDADQWGSTYQLGIDANITDWGVSVMYTTPDEDWVKLTPRRYKNEVSVQIVENTGREARAAKIVLSGSDGKGVKELMVEQSGIVYYILPYMGFWEDEDAVGRFEFRRKSESMVFLGMDKNERAYETVSPAFHKISYRFYEDDMTYKECYIYAKEGDFFEKEMDGFKNFLKDNGFKDEGANVFFNETLGVRATIQPTGNQPHVHYRYVPKQPNAMPTFESIPYGFAEFWKAKQADVESYEAKNNGEYNDERSNLDGYSSIFLFYDVKNVPNLMARCYYIEKKNDVLTTLNQTVQYYTKQSLVFYEGKGEIYLTNEFKALMEKEGFVFENFSSGLYRFKNDTKKLRIAVRWGVYGKIVDKVVGLHIIPFK